MLVLWFQATRSFENFETLMSLFAAKHLITKNFRMQFEANENRNLQIYACEFCYFQFYPEQLTIKKTLILHTYETNSFSFWQYSKNKLKAEK